MGKKSAAEIHRGIILQVRNVGEGHRVVDAWLQDVGRVSLWARHARSSKKRFGSALSPFCQVSLHAEPRDNLWHLTWAELEKDRHAIRHDLSAIGRAATLVRVVQALWPTKDNQEGMFEGLTVALDHLGSGRLARAAGLYPRLASMAGLLPSAERCGGCNAPMVGAPRAPVRLPHLVCARCDPHAPALEAAVHGALSGARIEDEATARATEALIVRWVNLFSGQRIVPWAAQALLPKPPSP